MLTHLLLTTFRILFYPRLSLGSVNYRLPLSQSSCAMYEMAPFRRPKRNFGWKYDNYPAFDIANFGGVGALGGLSGVYGWNGGFDTQHYDVPGTIEQATRSHVEAQNDFEKAKEKYEEAKKKYEECEKKGMWPPGELHTRHRLTTHPFPVKEAEQMLNLAKYRAGAW